MTERGSARVNVLLVDDQPENLLALQATLEPLGQNLVCVGSGREALRMLLQQDFAVILLDVVMPELDGFETAELIRRRERTSKTPILFLTALAHGEVPQFKAYSVGAVDYLVKPFEPEILRSKVSVFVDLALKNELILRQAEELRKSEQREHERQLTAALQRMEAERTAAREALLRRELESERDQQAWLESVLHAMPMPLVLLEPNTGRSLFSNRAAQMLAEGAFVQSEVPPVKLCDSTGKPFGPGELPRYRAASGHRLSGVPVQWHGESTSGSCLLFSEKLPESFGHPETILLALSDVTRLKAVEQDLMKAVRQRDDFLSIASHELKTPLTSLKMNVQGTLHNMESHKGSMSYELMLERMRRLDRNVNRLSVLVDQLLDLSRINAGRLEFEWEELDLNDVVQEVAGRFQEDLARAHCELTLNIEGQILGRWDRGRLDQVVTNLLSNALKYAAGKPVTVTTTCMGSRAILEVVDQGPGIAPEDQDRIFERFERCNPSSGTSGFGLGLWIVRQIVTAMRGWVDVKSVPGAGATFRVDVPRDAAVSQVEEKPSSARAVA